MCEQSDEFLATKFNYLTIKTIFQEEVFKEKGAFSLTNSWSKRTRYFIIFSTTVTTKLLKVSALMAG